jgi:hypothetical protein
MLYQFLCQKRKRKTEENKINIKSLYLFRLKMLSVENIFNRKHFSEILWCLTRIENLVGSWIGRGRVSTRSWAGLVRSRAGLSQVLVGSCVGLGKVC